MSCNVTCPHCNGIVYDVSPGDMDCPSCGVTMKVNPKPCVVLTAFPAPAKSSKTGNRIYIAGWVVLVWLMVLAFFMMVGTGQSKNESETSNPRKIYAREVIDVAEKAVKNRLRAPSTAKFPELFGEDGYKVVKTTSKSSDVDCVSVLGWVDSQNGFGAMLRSWFLVNLKRDSSRIWSIEHVSIDTD